MRYEIYISGPAERIIGRCVELKDAIAIIEALQPRYCWPVHYREISKWKE